MADEKLIAQLEEKARKISKQMASSTIGFKEKGYLRGQLDQINETLAKLASDNGSNKNG